MQYVHSAAMAWSSRRGSGHFGLGPAPVKKYLHLSFHKKIFAFAEFYFQNILLQQKGLYVDLKIICDFPLKNI